MRTAWSDTLSEDEDDGGDGTLAIARDEACMFVYVTSAKDADGCATTAATLLVPHSARELAAALIAFAGEIDAEQGK